MGEPSRELPLHAVGLDGRPVDLLAGVATVEDSSILTLEGRRVRPRTPGWTIVSVDIGECVTHVAAHVEERVESSMALQPMQQFATDVRLVPWEVRSWRVAPGMYRMELLPATLADTVLLLAAWETNCVPEGRIPQVYFCLSRPGASAIVSHPGRAGSGPARAATLRLHRLAIPSAYDPPGTRYPERRRPRAARERRVREREKPACAMQRAGEGPRVRAADPSDPSERSSPPAE